MNHDREECKYLDRNVEERTYRRRDYERIRLKSVGPHKSTGRPDTGVLYNDGITENGWSRIITCELEVPEFLCR